MHIDALIAAHAIGPRRIIYTPFHEPRKRAPYLTDDDATDRADRRGRHAGQHISSPQKRTLGQPPVSPHPVAVTGRNRQGACTAPDPSGSARNAEYTDELMGLALIHELHEVGNGFIFRKERQDVGHVQVIRTP